MDISSFGTLIDVRGIAPGERYACIRSAFRNLGLGEVLEFVSENDAKTIYREFQVEVPGDFSWCYLEVGPAGWRVSIKKLSRAYSEGECCGQCRNAA
jgi:uncharacterized protein (DUF2249 family)